MAWLIVCPHHKTGIFGLLFLFFALFHQPTLHGFNESGYYYKKKLLFIIKKIKQIKFYKQFSFNLEFNLFHQFFYFFNVSLYTNTFYLMVDSIID